MKRLLLWLVGVALGVVVLLGAVMAVSYAFTTQGSCPAPEVRFGDEALEVNGYCWQVPLLSGQLDKVFASPETLTVQKLGTFYDAHPALTLPEWASYATLTIENTAGSVVYTGSAGDYAGFLFPANGEYKASLTVWRLPAGGTVTRFEGGNTGAIRRNSRLEKPARPTGWYGFSFRFTLQASAEVELSADRVEQGGIVGVAITGMTGDTAPTVETDLGKIQCARSPGGWRAYIPAAYNASAGGHEVNITVNGETLTRTITVLPKDFGTVELAPEPEASEAANNEFRNAVWPLYEQPAREKLWAGGFACPAENYMKLAGPEPGPHGQHRGHRPRLRRAQLPLRLADHRRGRGCSCGAGPERGLPGRGADHGLQAGQQERQPLAAVPVQRRPVLAGKSVKISKKVDAARDAASTFCCRKC